MTEIGLVSRKNLETSKNNPHRNLLLEGSGGVSTGNPLLNDAASPLTAPLVGYNDTETNSSPADAADRTLSPVSIEIKPVLFDHDDEIDVGRLLNFCHLIYFGSGRYFYVTISSAVLVVIIAVAFVQRGFIHSQDKVLIPIFIALVIEEVVNITFGYQFIKFHGLEQVLLSTKNVRLREKWIVYLRRGYYVAVLFSISNLSRQVFFPNSAGDTDDTFGISQASGPLHGFIFFVINALQLYIFSLNYYLLVIWCWVCFSLNDHWNVEIAPLFTEENVSNGSVQRRHFEFLESISFHSNRWAVNHIVRTVTGVVITVGNMAMLYQNLERKQYGLVGQHATFIATYYLSVWLTFISAGYVNDSIARVSRQKLADMLVRAEDKATRAEAAYFLQALEATNRGFRVGGVTMHVEKAMTAGSLILTAVIAVVKVHSV